MSTASQTVPVVRTRKSPYSLGRTLRYLALLFGLVIVLIPVYVLFVTSFKSGAAATASQAVLIPTASAPRILHIFTSWGDSKFGPVSCRYVPSRRGIPSSRAVFLRISWRSLS